MRFFREIIQALIASSIFNVWLLRYEQPTPYRGGSARNMREEFAAYGFPPAVMYLVGGSKLASAACLIVGHWVPGLVRPAAVVMALLMVGAIGMHVKIGDPPKKGVPAMVMLLLSLFVAVAAPGSGGQTPTK